MNIFLDLEETVIDDIEHCRFLPVNVFKIKEFISCFPKATFESFTFAIWNEIDKMRVEGVLFELEEQLDIKIKMQEWLPKDIRHQFVNETLFKVSDKEMLDFGAFANKQRCFEWFCKKFHSNERNILIDDTVETKRIIFRKSNLEIITINVNDINEFSLLELGVTSL